MKDLEKMNDAAMNKELTSTPERRAQVSAPVKVRTSLRAGDLTVFTPWNS